MIYKNNLKKGEIFDMKIAIDKGHCLYGFDTSADGRSVGGFLESE